LATDCFKNLTRIALLMSKMCTSIQDAFRWSSGRDETPRPTVSPTHSLSTPVYVHTQSVEMDAVSAVLQSHDDWEVGARTRAVAALQHLPQLIPAGQDSLPAYTEKELCDGQLNDRNLSCVLCYVGRRRRPSRRE
jgi:hypothetical protein